MRQSIKRAGYLVAAVLLALVGVVTVTGTASAASTTMAAATRVQSCPFPSGPTCVTDSGIIPKDSRALTFCFTDIYNIIYSVQRERGGFVNRTTLTTPSRVSCAGAGGIGIVNSNNAPLRACAESTCRSFGSLPVNTPVGLFCTHNGAYLVNADSKALAGFMPTGVVTIQGSAPAPC